MISLPSGTRIWLVAGATDMRKSFNGLGEQIHHVLDEDPFSGHLFIFRGRRGDTVKILWADADGLCLFIKRLEEGQFVWPAVRDGKIAITRSQLAMLLGVRLENGIYGHSRFCNTDFDDKLACLNLSGV
ncbi:IS66 family insertion sequence element accessory protein TnpB [Klebsiella variicola]|uniref:IS66 family insertion sequence element accessory protein TnpB n=21 Tax=Enterobacteriaceae TaxID=543 RepID=UPI001D0D8F20|nr:IS66 family insertion sequence element accessory protein TnpB [Klebsiella variicola]